MKKAVLLAIAFCLILVAGCSTTTSSPPATPAPAPAPAAQPVAVKEVSVMKSGNYSLITSIDHIDVDSKDSGRHTVNIYLTVRNNGTESQRLVWYSKLTGKNGLSYGGVGVSHGGSGARTFVLYPGDSNTARDYVTVDSEQEYAALKNGGATLDVEYADQASPLEPIPNLHSTWILEPSYFT